MQNIDAKRTARPVRRTVIMLSDRSRDALPATPLNCRLSAFAILDPYMEVGRKLTPMKGATSSYELSSRRK
jgi:hypothetical protein